MSSRNPAADNDPVDDADDRSGLAGVGDDGVPADNGSADVETGGDAGGRTRTKNERQSVKRGTGGRSAPDDASGRSACAAAATAASIPAIVLDAIRNLLARPLASYQLILTMSFLLTTFGLVMVLSASSVEGYSKEGSAYGLFATQVIFALLGLVVFYFMLRIPVRLLRRFAAPAMFVAVVRAHAAGSSSTACRCSRRSW